MRNHTATHLLNWALRKVLGEHVEQKGSLVDADKTRFDFTHDKPLTPEEIAEVERLVNEKIYADLPVTAGGDAAGRGEEDPRRAGGLRREVSRPGARAADRRRAAGGATLENSVEFCGGTHLTHTGQAGFFKIVSQEAVGKGVRRVTAVTGREAVAAVQQLSSVAGRPDRPASTASRRNCRRASRRLQEEIKKLQQQLKKGAAGDLAGRGRQAAGGGGRGERRQDHRRRDAGRRRTSRCASRWTACGRRPAAPWSSSAGRTDGKVSLIAAVTDDLVQEGPARRQAGRAGGEGGRRRRRRQAELAQAGGKDPAKLGEALELGREPGEPAAEPLGARFRD